MGQEPETVAKNRIEVHGIEVAWDIETGLCTCAGLPVATLWIDSTMSGLMAGMQAMVGTDRFGLALQAEGRNSVADDWVVISQFEKFEEGFAAIAQVAVVAGWGKWHVTSVDRELQECRFRVYNSWEAGYQKSLGVAWGSNMLAGKLAGYCSRLFGTNCWAEQKTFIAKGDAYDEFFVRPSRRSVEDEIEALLATDEATRADMAVALKRLAQEIEERRKGADERLQLETQMQHAQKLESLGVLAGGIAHDFNNLLVSVLGNAELALLSLPAKAPATDNLRHIVETAQRAGDLCKQLLAYSGRGRFVLSAIDLSEEVRGLSQILAVSLSKKSTVHYELADDLPVIEGDATQIRQILLNLMTNASEALDGLSGTIHVSTGVMHCNQEYLAATAVDDALPESDYVYVTVRDSGCGMPAEAQRIIFDPFYTTKFTGRGLGLAAVLGIIRGHDGAIELHSESGEGSSFRILFPVVPAVEAERPKPAKIGSTASPATIQDDTKFSGTALLVDDEPMVRRVTSRLLTALGFEVLVAKNGREALSIYRDNADAIVLILSDLMMPEMDGEELLVALRKVNDDVCVILSSGYNEQDVAQKFTAEGLAGFIHKPYRLDDLRAVIQAAFDKDE